MIGVEKWRNYYLRGKLFKMRAALKRAEDENMGGRRAFGPRDECLCASSLSLCFCRRPDWPWLCKRCLDCSSGVTQGITGHMEEERGDWVKEGWVRAKTDGLMDTWIRAQPETNVLAERCLLGRKKEEEDRQRRRRES